MKDTFHVQNNCHHFKRIFLTPGFFSKTGHKKMTSISSSGNRTPLPTVEETDREVRPLRVCVGTLLLKGCVPPDKINRWLVDVV